MCGEGFEHRTRWIEQRLETLSTCFAVSVCGFAVMDNHLHVPVRLDADAVHSWSAEEVVRRWSTPYPPKSATGEEIEVSQAWIEQQAKDEQRVVILRTRLASLGWFMKALKEPLARLSREVASILERLGTSAEVWGQRIRKLFGKARLLGSYFSTDRQRLRDVACRRRAGLSRTCRR